METIGHWINGRYVQSQGREQGVYNPAHGEIRRNVQLAERGTVEDAILAAQAAFQSWRDTPATKRARVMFRFKQLVEENLERLTHLIGEEHGKTASDAMGELQRGLENIEFACGIADALKGEHSKNVGTGIDSWSEFQPLGVVAGITPFNFPVMVPMWMFPLAIACGNTFVLKPSERVPSSTLLLGELLSQAGLPNGVFNIVNGDKEAVDVLLSDERIKAVSFVGSTAIAETIYKKASENGKRCQALGGAKNHAIVMPDADIESTVNQLLGAAFGSSGERCMALSVVVAVGDAIADQLVEKLQQEMSKLQVGSCEQGESDFGPLITYQHQQKVSGYIDSAQEQGADIVVDGRNIEVAGYESGYFIGGTLIDNVTAEMTSYQEEIFGPVLQVMRVESMEEAMSLINDHEYGNGTCIFTRDGEAARYFSDRIEVGMVGINVPLPVPVSYHSFGGWKRSLFGDLSAYGPDGIRFYTKRKTITQRWLSAELREKAQFAFPS
ncbi:Methylmalonate-semialdehyde dehydrogenase (acylating) [Vibrio nigripulchritudo SO65]|uniref:CoA-acylating methylmalonate-semialdehyde dehydrogenase n=1 Tax=Vibrio nigripulchritudo TaxID=28173 RepID=UPI0003B19045|nr:CoA-acylating methylmalonate-semialdehyde dehydrogenase [Vibrio nigripulchritudo]CCN33513.1 Methylmalonate-semialdehyde dehydrogenase (acylating) [Vibrio nigripulchritudo AM115]CCN41520.1 Methylmalonate-semialdehyde dehydrogenase (acylating) [Vibrio nigripulchritudo FTn2]CCN64197.1 Methylmalonate-semialdehyde dehydrogenase (acylating) [Vibrio nigripulchritudo POn4]CCN75737.1 Methylmalonate-semialdehyde dehydrogenase (acylating) [Vibrio nigripulchritudo SO65]